MSETLLHKAITNYDTAEMIYKHMDGDERFLNLIGYHLQQSVELAIKYLLEMNGVEYPKTHDIDQLIRIANQNNANLYLTDYIDEHSEMLSMWESKTRYVLNYQLELRKVDTALSEIKKYIDLVQKDITLETNITMDNKPVMDNELEPQIEEYDDYEDR